MMASHSFWRGLPRKLGGKCVPLQVRIMWNSNHFLDLDRICTKAWLLVYPAELHKFL